ncbi:MAG TPA: hypothetical protein VN370_02385 [Desulfitobacteriaceae bacterium]|nr:hypothetical protein [Desulfitobacteriaceae bacterium]
MNVLFDEVGFTHEYRSEYEEFYRPYFNSEEELTAFFVSVFERDSIDKTPRRMMNQIQRFVSLANDIDSIRAGRDPLRVLFLRICLESLYSLSKQNSAKKHRIKDFFKEYISEAGQQYILNHFTFRGLEPICEIDAKSGMLYNCKSRYSLSIDDFSMIFYIIRGMVVHEGDYWSMQLFGSDDNYTSLVFMSTDKQIVDCHQSTKGTPISYFFETTLSYKKFIYYYVDGCIQFLKTHI